MCISSSRLCTCAALSCSATPRPGRPLRLAERVHLDKHHASKRRKSQMARNTSVMGIYSDRATVSGAVNVLTKAGYRPMDISVLLSDNPGNKDFAHEKHTKAAHGAAIGAIVGAVVGASLAWFISTQPASFSGFMSLAAVGMLGVAGPLLSAWAGAGAGGTLGWMAGFLMGLGLTEYVAKRYAGRIRRGGIL